MLPVLNPRRGQQTKNVRESRVLGSKILLDFFATFFGRPVVEFGIDVESIQRLDDIGTVGSKTSLEKSDFEKNLRKFNDAIIHDKVLGSRNREKFEALIDGYSYQYFSRQGEAQGIAIMDKELTFAYRENVIIPELLKLSTQYEDELKTIGNNEEKKKLDADAKFAQKVKALEERFKENVKIEDMKNFKVFRTAAGIEKLRKDPNFRGDVTGNWVTYANVQDYAANQQKYLKELWDENIDARYLQVKQEYLSKGADAAAAFKGAPGNRSMFKRASQEKFNQGVGHDRTTKSLLALLAIGSGLGLEMQFLSPHTKGVAGNMLYSATQGLESASGVLDAYSEQIIDMMKNNASLTTPKFVKSYITGLNSALNDGSSAASTLIMATVTAIEGYKLGALVGDKIAEKFKLEGSAGKFSRFAIGMAAASTGLAIFPHLFSFPSTPLPAITSSDPLFLLASLVFLRTSGYNAGMSFYDSISPVGSHNYFLRNYLAGNIGSACTIGGGYFIKEYFNDICASIGIAVTNLPPNQQAAVINFTRNAIDSFFPIWAEMASTVFLYAVAIPYIIYYLRTVYFNKNTTGTTVNVSGDIWVTTIGLLKETAITFFLTFVLYGGFVFFLGPGATGLAGIPFSLVKGGYFAFRLGFALWHKFGVNCFYASSRSYSFTNWLVWGVPRESGLPIVLSERYPDELSYKMFVQNTLKDADWLNGKIWPKAELEDPGVLLTRPGYGVLGHNWGGDYFKTTFNPTSGVREVGAELVENRSLYGPITYTVNPPPSAPTDAKLLAAWRDKYLLRPEDLRSPAAGADVNFKDQTTIIKEEDFTATQVAWKWLKDVRSWFVLGTGAFGAGAAVWTLTSEYNDKQSSFNSDIASVLEYMNSASEPYEFTFRKLQEYIKAEFATGDVPESFSDILNDLEALTEGQTARLGSMEKYKDLLEAKIKAATKEWGIMKGVEATMEAAKTQSEATTEAAKTTADAYREGAQLQADAAKEAAQSLEVARTMQEKALTPENIEAARKRLVDLLAEPQLGVADTGAGAGAGVAPVAFPATSAVTGAFPVTGAATGIAPGADKYHGLDNLITEGATADEIAEYLVANKMNYDDENVIKQLVDEGMDLKSVKQAYNTELEQQKADEARAKEREAEYEFSKTGMAHKRKGGKKTKRSKKQKKGKRTRRNKN